MKRTFFLITLLLSSLVTLSDDMSKDLIWQMGGSAPIDASIKLYKHAKWVAIPGLGTGLEFFGDGSWARVPNFPANKIGDEVTISFFFKCHDLIPQDKKKTCGAIFSYKYQWLGRVYKTGKIYGGLRNKKGKLKGIFSAIKIKPETWHHLALVWSSKKNNFSAYLDGIRVGVRRDKISPLKKLSGYKFAFGKDPDGSFFNGVIADFRIYNRPLHLDKVKKLASSTSKALQVSIIKTKAKAAKADTMKYRFTKYNPSKYSSTKYTLVKDGVSQCAIVLPHDATASMEYGANDLKKHLKLISGAKIAIYKQKNNSDLPGKYAGVIMLTNTPAKGKSSVGTEEFWITSKPGKPWTIRIYGDNKRGAMYGCYAFLQDVLGCRWFTSSISRIPKQKTITVGTLNIHQKPSFELRDSFFYKALRDTKWLVRNHLNGLNCKLNDSVGGKVIYGTVIAHTMLRLVPPSKYFAAHPEYFALVKGKRVNNRQLCLTNPDTLKICIARIKQLIKKKPSATIFSISQMDNEGGSCQCENCLKVKNREGAESGPILAFVNAVAKEIGKEYPNILIETLAYNYSQKAPKFERPLPNVRIRFCTPWTCKAHPMDAGCDKNKNTFRDLKAWGKITKQIYIWDYNTEFNDYMLFHPSLDYTKTIFDIFNKNGVVGVFMQGSYNSAGGFLSEMKAYLCARLMWDHTQNPDTLVDEYLQGVYGKAAPIIKEWINLIHSPFKKNHNLCLGIYDKPSSHFLTKAILDRSDELIEKAIAIASDDPIALEELGKVRMWIDYTRIARIKLKPDVKDGKYTYGVKSSDLDRIDRWSKSIKHYKIGRIGEGIPVSKLDVLTKKNAELTCLSLENNKLRIDILPTLGGKIIRLLDKKNNLDLMLPPKSIFHKSEGGYEEYVTPKQLRAKYQNLQYTKSPDANTFTLKGQFTGREITKQFKLKGNTIILETTVKNTSSSPLAVNIWTCPQFSLRSFKDVHISFDMVGGGSTEFEAKDFSINWSELHKRCKGNEKPSGKVILKLKNTTITNHFNSQKLDMLHVFNNGGRITEKINLELHTKSITLQPNESTSFEQRWVIE